MASRLYLRNIDSGLGDGGVARYMLPGRGSAVVTNTVTLTAAGDNIPWTITAGGTAARWVSPRVPAGGFTLDGNITFNAWARESNNNDETTIGFRVYKLSGGVETEISGSPFSFGTELTTTITAKNWTGDPGSTSFAENDRIVIVPIAIATTTMTAGSADLTTNGATAAASGDSYIELTETVDWKTETITKTIKTSGGDYSLLSAWEAAQQSDLVTDDVIAQAECYAGDYTDNLAISGWTTGASNYIRIYTPTAERHDGRSREVSGVGAAFTHATSNVLRVDEDYVRFEGLIARATGTTNTPFQMTAGRTAGNNLLKVDDCIFYNNTAVTVTTSYLIAVSQAEAIVTLRNIIAYGEAFRALQTTAAASVEASHCTFYGGGSDGVVGDLELTCKNVFAGGYTGECFDTSGAAPAGSHNASTDATAQIDYTNSLINLTAADQFVSLTGGAEDFHLKAGSDLEEAGTPLGAVTTDIDEDARDGTTPDIGADEFTSSIDNYSVTADGGPIAAGSGVLDVDFNVTASGGPIAAGSGALDVDLVITGSGGPIISGDGPIDVDFVITGNGGPIVSGDGVVVFDDVDGLIHGSETADGGPIIDGEGVVVYSTASVTQTRQTTGRPSWWALELLRVRANVEATGGFVVGGQGDIVVGYANPAVEIAEPPVDYALLDRILKKMAQPKPVLVPELHGTVVVHFAPIIYRETEEEEALLLLIA
jgi:hypothetical protein